MKAAMLRRLSKLEALPIPVPRLEWDLSVLSTGDLERLQELFRKAEPDNWAALSVEELEMLDAILSKVPRCK